MAFYQSQDLNATEAGLRKLLGIAEGLTWELERVGLGEQTLKELLASKGAVAGLGLTRSDDVVVLHLYLVGEEPVPFEITVPAATGRLDQGPVRTLLDRWAAALQVDLVMEHELEPSDRVLVPWVPGNRP